MTMLIHPELADCRRLFLRNYAVEVRIGVYEHEKAAAQRILFNVDLYVPLAWSTPRDDRLDEVVDYDHIRHQIQEHMAHGEHIELQETLCDGLLARLLAHPRVKAARVSTEKPDIYPDSDGVGCEVFAIKKEPA
jgi:dihydroneopterin aldolase